MVLMARRKTVLAYFVHIYTSQKKVHIWSKILTEKLSDVRGRMNIVKCEFVVGLCNMISWPSRGFYLKHKKQLISNVKANID
jgi:hypothetical protein